MYFKHLQHAIGRVTARILGPAPAEQQYGPREMEQLAESIVEYGRMRQEHYSSHAVLIGAGEVAMRLRETTHVIVQAFPTPDDRPWLDLQRVDNCCTQA